jgi:hypothetical protein
MSNYGNEMINELSRLLKTAAHETPEGNLLPDFMGGGEHEVEMPKDLEHLENLESPLDIFEEDDIGPVTTEEEEAEFGSKEEHEPEYFLDSAALIRTLTKLANDLDGIGALEAANKVDDVLKKMAK